MALELCASLESRGFACWIAPRDIPEGQPYPVGIINGIEESEALLLLASESALASNQVISEVEQAHKRAMRIYTVLIPPAAVRGEMDFYLSRLQWMESAGKSADGIAARLAAVLGGECAWDDVASPPTLRRTLRYRPIAFAKLVTTAALGMALVLGGGIFALNRALNLDFRRLGYVDFAAEPTEDGSALVGHLRVWALATGARFADMQLRMAAEPADGSVGKAISEWPLPQQVGSMETVEIPLGAAVRQVTTCLIVPNGGMNALWRVTQRFAIKPQREKITVAETAEKLVSKEDGSTCGARPRE